MKKIVFDFDPQKCSACGACAIACMDQNDVDVEAGMQPYRKVYEYESATERVYISIACLHCPDAPCVTACPVGCIYKDAETGLTLYHTDNCVGCHSCAMACPYGAPTFRPPGAKRPREKMEKCHGCVERIKVGKQPACVHSCPTGALGWHWSDDPEEKSELAHIYESWNALTPSDK